MNNHDSGKITTTQWHEQKFHTIIHYFGASL